MTTKFLKQLVMGFTMTVALMVFAASPERFTFANRQGLNGDWALCLSERVSAPENFAMEEFTGVVARMMRAKDSQTLRNRVFYLSPEKFRCRGDRMIVIADAASPLLADKLDRLGIRYDAEHDRIVNKVMDGNLYLVGSNPRATLFSVYRFLKEECGVRWLWPGASGEFLPATLSCSANLDFSYAPPFESMTLLDHSAEDIVLWCVRNYSHNPRACFGGRDRGHGGESVSPFRSDYQKHPDWFAMNDKGKRELPPDTGWSWVINGCWANDGFTQAVVDRVAAAARKGFWTQIDLSPADSAARCLCEKCLAMHPDKSTRWWIYQDQLRTELKKRLPYLSFGALAYQEFLQVPGVDVKDFRYVQYAQYDRCYVHPFADPRCAINRTSLENMEKWLKKYPRIGVLGYEFCAFPPKTMEVPYWRIHVDEMRKFRSLGLVMVENFWDSAPRLSSYSWLRAAWNPDLEPEAIVADFARTVFGDRAAAPLITYYNALADAWEKMDFHITNCYAKPDTYARYYLSPELIALADKTFTELEAAAKKLPPDRAAQARELIANERAAFAKWKVLYDKALAGVKSVQAFIGDSFEADGVTMPMVKRQKWETEPHRTVSTIYRDGQNLHFRIQCFEPAKPTAKFLPPKKDGWADEESIEVFLQLPGSADYFQFQATRGGSIYDAKVNDVSWNSGWTSRITESSGSWTAELTIPFASFGVVPQDNDVWKIVVIRNSAPTPCGFPVPAYHEMGNAADLIFAPGKRP